MLSVQVQTGFSVVKALARRAMGLARSRRRQIVPRAIPQSAKWDRQQNVSRGLADTLDRAVELGLWEHAERVAKTAAQLARVEPTLAERIARLRFAQGNPEGALAVIDACAKQTSSLRLMRATCLIQSGRAAEAHLDLYEWSCRSSAPSQARLLLALLEWRDGETESATKSLRRNLRHLHDPSTLAALMLICAQQGRDDAAHCWARIMRQSLRDHDRFESIDVMARALGFIEPKDDRDRAQAQRSADLARELVACEQVIPALVEAEKVAPRSEQTTLLHSAIEQALPQLEEKNAAQQALEKLHSLLQDVEQRDSNDATREVLAVIGPQSAPAEAAA